MLCAGAHGTGDAAPPFSHPEPQTPNIQVPSTPRTELLLQQAMSTLRQDRTSFVIAHRLSTIRDADLILVMGNGSIVEQGTHAELLAARGAYYALYNAQFTEPADVAEAEAEPAGEV
ncbi:hypothetical protein GCM10027416_28100 [Okibacterium endophyticum]